MASDSAWYASALYLGRQRPLSASCNLHNRCVSAAAAGRIARQQEQQRKSSPQVQFAGAGAADRSTLQAVPHYAGPVRKQGRRQQTSRPASAAPRLERRMAARAQRRTMGQTRSCPQAHGNAAAAARRSSLLYGSADHTSHRRTSATDSPGSRGDMPFWERLQAPVWAERRVERAPERVLPTSPATAALGAAAANVETQSQSRSTGIMRIQSSPSGDVSDPASALHALRAARAERRQQQQQSIQPQRQPLLEESHHYRRQPSNVGAPTRAHTEQLLGRCECCDEVLHTTGTPQLLCHECAAIDLGSFRPAAAANALARTNQAERLVTAALDLRDERLTKTACAEDGTRLTCSVCLDSMRAGQSVSEHIASRPYQ